MDELAAEIARVRNTVGTMRLANANTKWWRKPLVMHDGRATTAELAILNTELEAGEQGAWLNSRGTKTGVVELVPRPTGNADSFQTRRVQLPAFVSRALETLYSDADLNTGCPDLVIWCDEPPGIRLVEVKCPHCDKSSPEQKKFMSAAAAAGIPAKLVEWEFEPRQRAP